MKDRASTTSIGLDPKPADCTCVYTMSGVGNGSVFIAAQHCPAAPHPRHIRDGSWTKESDNA